MKKAIGWGILLWLIGYVLGIVLFFVVPPELIGWVIMPVGAALAIWVAFRKISAPSFGGYVRIAVLWTLIAVVFDYLFLVLVFKPADGYYKPDVYLYYALTFLIPLCAGWLKKTSK